MWPRVFQVLELAARLRAPNTLQTGQRSKGSHRRTLAPLTYFQAPTKPDTPVALPYFTPVLNPPAPSPARTLPASRAVRPCFTKKRA